MSPDVRIAIAQTFPTQLLSEPDTDLIAKSPHLSLAPQILDQLRRLPGVECGQWEEVEDYDRAISLAIHEPNPTFWSYGQSIDKRAEVIRQNGGAYYGLGLSVSKCGPFWCTHLSCFSLGAADQIAVSFQHSAPTSFWAGIDARLVEIFAAYPLRRLNEDELGEEVDWIDPDREPFERYPEKVTVYHCLFDFV